MLLLSNWLWLLHSVSWCCLQDCIQQLLERDPEKRMGSKAGAEEIKAHPFFKDINWALIRHGSPPFIPRRTNRQAQATTTNSSGAVTPAAGSLTNTNSSGTNQQHFQDF